MTPPALIDCAELGYATGPQPADGPRPPVLGGRRHFGHHQCQPVTRLPFCAASYHPSASSAFRASSNVGAMNSARALHLSHVATWGSAGRFGATSTADSLRYERGVRP